MSRKKFFKSLGLVVILFLCFLAIKAASAQIDAGTDVVGQEIALGSDDPRAVAARVANIAMLFLATIAVIIVLIGGFKWMTSGGDEKKVSDAKALLRNGVIGLVIILAAWGIARFVINRLVDATNNGGSGACSVGALCGTCGSWEQDSDGYCSCVGNDNCGLAADLDRCTTLPGDPGCQDGTCDPGFTCDETCHCQPGGSLGSACNSDPGSATCIPDNTKCGPYLSCDAASCTCQGAPAITEISPVGGFCTNDVNQACAQDSDCSSSGGICNQDAPNGQAGNLITIAGYNFGAFGSNSKVLFVSADGSSEIAAAAPPGVCAGNYWQDQEIVVAIPAALNGTYQLKVVRDPDGSSDTTSDKNGPKLPDFQSNNIARPGLCALEPNSAQSGSVLFYGARLSSGATDGQANFGNYTTSIAAATKIINPETGTTTLPELAPQKTNFFVSLAIAGFPQKSNYLKFQKVGDKAVARYISGFEPTSGPKDQYVTIRGKGFGRLKGKGGVYFVKTGDPDKEANYDFPKICADSLWSDEQILVKVPAGLADNNNYILKVILFDGETTLTTADLVPPLPTSFQFKTNDPLTPGLCKLSPVRGQVNTSVKLWGEYFGSTGGNASVIFYSEIATNSPIKLAGDNKAQEIDTQVPASTASGPVVVRKDKDSNPLNFTVGACQTDDECGSQICCPAGAYKAGACVDTPSDCYSSSLNSVFEWRFNTNYSNLINNYSCNGWAKATGACQTGQTCPNSPGQCSPFNNGAPVDKGACCPNGFAFDQASGRCLQSNGGLCDLSFQTTTTAPVVTCSKLNNNSYHWLINSASLPASSTAPHPVITSWINLGNNKYTDSTSTVETTFCQACPDDQSCIANSSGQGVCSLSTICPGGSTCDADSKKCLEQASCQCCCEVGQDARDCCAGLKCGGACGNDTNTNLNKTSGFGRCSGCASAGITQEDHDAACNCSGHSGQYCETNDPNFPAGYCNDCDSLSGANCASHNSVCCIDGKGDNACRGANDSKRASIGDDKGLSYCAYYDCAGSLCASSTPFAYGLYENEEICGQACAANPGTDHCSTLDQPGCAADQTCCWDDPNSECASGNKINDGGVNNDYCAYYACDSGVCSGPTTSGVFRGLDVCQTQCRPAPGAGLDCSGTNNNGACNTFICSNPFQCLNSNGGAGSSGDCGSCCCQISDDKCGDINTLHPGVNLKCEPDQAPCSGSDRGLCCGCLEDDYCGDATTTGCDANACCRNRPVVETGKTVPAERAENVCRNALVKVTFNQEMDVSHLADNVLLLEKSADGSCPAGTFLAAVDGSKPLPQSNYLVRAWRRLNIWSRGLLSLFDRNQTALADFSAPDQTDVYCSIPGTTSLDSDRKTVTFSPGKLLSADTVHYLIVKGDHFLRSDAGVLSYFGVGLNGNGLDYTNDSVNNPVEGETLKFNNINYDNSYISVFRTMKSQGANSGICTVDHVRTSPASYLFQTTTPDLNESNDPLQSSFDSKRDNDKVFAAYALSSDNQYLNPVPAIYDWTWAWQIDKPAVASTSVPASLAVNKTLVTAASGVQDDSAVLTATLNMPSGQSRQDGNGSTADTPIYVFVCTNPWPPIQASGDWSPWKDNCDNSLTNPCSNFNYKFYYCRDAGATGTADDLPAINPTAVTRGQSSVLVCSQGGATCSTQNDACGNGGICIISVLKESYFFRSSTPGTVTITELTDKKVGGTVEIKWRSKSTLIYGATPQTLGAYKIYYGISGSSQTSKRVQPNEEINGARVCSTVSGPNQEYVCALTITGLSDQQSYVFYMTALTSNNAESDLSAPVEVTPTDQRPPEIPIGFGAGG